MPEALSTIAPIAKIAAPIAGTFLGGFGASSREKEALKSASRSLVLRNQNPFFTSRFDPRSQAFTLAASPEIQSILQRAGEFKLPRIRPTVDFSDFAGEAGRLSGSVDEIVGDLTQIEETLKNRLADLGVSQSQLAGMTTEQLMNLLAMVEPGFGRLTESVDEAFELARQRLADRQRAATGDLRESLSRRRILGSSFAADAQSRQEAEFERGRRELVNAQATARAQNFLQELDLSRQIVQQNFDNTFRSIQSRIATTISEFNARLARVQTELGARFKESDFRLGAFTEANRQALAFGQNLQQAATVEQQQQNELFKMFESLGNTSVKLTSDLQGAFSGLNQTIQELLAQAAAGRGAAFGATIDRFGNLEFPNNPLIGGSGSDVLDPLAGTFVDFT